MSLWEDVRKILEEASGTVVSDRAIDTMQSMWEENKGQYFPYLGKDYRIKKVLEEEKPGLYHLEYAKRQMFNLASSLGQRERFQGLDYTASSYVENFVDHIELKELADNKIEHNYESLFSGVKHSKGMRVSRLLGNTIKSYSEDDWNRHPLCGSIDWRRKPEFLELCNILFSKVREALDNTRTTIVLSANPVDILLSSANTTGWRSCHNIYDGQFRGACLSYALDKATLVAYATRGKKEISQVLADIKMWRQMVYFSLNDGVAYHSRQYPGHDLVFSTQARRLAAKILTEHHNLPYEWKVRDAQGADDHNIYHQGGWHYSGDNLHRRIRIKGDKFVPEHEVEVGVSELPCVSCGWLNVIDDMPGLLCSDCRAFSYCDRCGEEILSENDAYYVENDYLCEYCAEYYTATCGTCGESYYLDNMTYLDHEEAYVCDYCLGEQYRRCEECGDYFYSDDLYHVKYAYSSYYYVCEDCLDEHYGRCEKCGDYFHNDDLHQVKSANSYYYVCKDCLDDYYDRCEKCDDFFDVDSLNVTSSGEYLCNECLEQIEEGGS